MTGRIIVVGSLNLDTTLRVDRLPGPGETVHSESVVHAPGGKGANQAVAAALLGGRVRLIGAVGDDDAGRMLTIAAVAAGVDVAGVRRVPVRTGQATIIVDRDAENVIVVDAGANASVDPTQVPEDLTAADVVVTGNEVPDAVVIAAAERAASVGAMVVHNPSPFRPLPGRMPRPQVLVVNEHEFALCGGRLEPVVVLPPALEDAALVVTRGAQGALVFERGGAAEVPAIRVEPVDTSGCGDAFLGAMVERIAAGCPVVEAVERAMLVGAFAATREGTQSSYPTASELRVFQDSRKG
ncbi:ribokinase [Microbacterium sp. XT11]|uniref:ribokinase n=1 Tax=Microbacterium sp. XT11 TaxID=367477 RepID=UPI000742D667|nr:ribokinase [Microbacterium sp. XT11]ALX66429.1 hypothetical protein AB663_001590 [Microbacterium sp. XT11]